jgi:radical SAM superfamily enzyme YgiQ (UPF0313 family)
MSLEQHPKGQHARVLLTSVFGPYAQDDEYGSRAINPVELYHNQVTRVQGPFSLRMFHRSWGIMMIQANISAPSMLLDFPSLEQFIQQIRENTYDIIGITSIIPNVGKVRKMCALIREYQPDCTIVVGGHIANLPDAAERFDADHIVKGEGISWFRRFLGQDDSDPIRHPEIWSGFGARVMGVKLSHAPKHTAATLIPSVGCPMGCNFCSTSAMFGGKGNFVNFFDTGRDLFQVMSRMEESMKTQSFFVMDENFLLHRARALELLGLMKQHGKSWSLYVFSSARSVQSYSMDELVGLGISWIWMGLEGEDSSYAKLRNMDTQVLVRDLHANGIRVLGSSIIGLETHTRENIDQVIDYAVAHDTDFHQFMLYTPVPGTPLYAEHQSKGTLIPGIDDADTHGQYAFNFLHPHISREESGEFLLRAFTRDYELNGPSVMRIARTLLEGWKRHKNHPEARVRERYRRECLALPLAYGSGLWAMERYFRDANAPLTKKIRQLRADLGREFGFVNRLAVPLLGPVVYQLVRREERRLNRGWTYQPSMVIEKRNWERLPQKLAAPAMEPLPALEPGQ